MNKKEKNPIFFQEISLKKKIELFISMIGKYFKQGNILNNSKVIIFYILLSLFPLLILIGNLLPLLHLNISETMEYIKLIFPTQVADLLNPTIRKILSQQSGGLISFGIIVALWSSSRGINSLRLSINEIYGVKDLPQYTQKTWLDVVIKRTMSFIITILSVIAFAIIAIVLIFGQILLEWLIKTVNLHQQFLSEFLTWKWPIALTILFLISLFMYYLLPSVKIRIRSVLCGTIVSTIGLSLLTQFFSLYMRYLGKSWSSYGTIGAFIVFLLWMNASSVVFMFGAVINAAFAECLDGSFTINTRNIISTKGRRK
ncbi:YihY/virulence factor BrkB family protein [Companilactobacillus sp. DQM5]|uniref:YihY/virulence factor BrkB family protein n=1 Tax=Companilactobacillus sp. DQM5 TaxID=3463359 RepID=UPI004058AC18